MTREDIAKMARLLGCNCEKLSAILLTLQDSETGVNFLASIDQNTTRENWTTIPGNSKEITYYPESSPGSDADNPSGNKNVESIIYSDSSGVVWTETFTYDSDDDVLTITST